MRILAQPLQARRQLVDLVSVLAHSPTLPAALRLKRSASWM